MKARCRSIAPGRIGIRSTFASAAHYALILSRPKNAARSVWPESDVISRRLAGVDCPVSLRRIAWSVVFAWALYCGNTVVGQTPTFKVLEAAIDQWYEQVEFVCSYEITRAEALSLDDALAGKAVQGTSKPYSYGKVVKKGGKTRQSLNYHDPPKQVSANEITFKPSEGVSNGEVEIYYSPNGDFTVPTISFNRLEQRSNRDRFQWQFLGPEVSPLNLTGSARAHPLRSLGERAVLAGEPKVTGTNAGEIQIEMERTDGSLAVKLIVTIDVRSTLPNAERFELRNRENGASYERVFVAQSSDFVNHNNAKIPRRIASATRMQNDRWRSVVWTSKDLGQREPTDEDFVLTVPAGVRVYGLKKLPRSDRPMKFDLDQITPADLLQESRAAAPPVDAQWRRIAGLFAGLTALVLVYAWRRWRAASAW